MVNTKTSFMAGFVITALTMSMSISVGILLPLYMRKIINKKMLIAYILWANVSTLFDTLFLGMMAKSILGIKVIIAFLIAVIAAVIFLMLTFNIYHRCISYITDKILSNRLLFFIFTIIIMFSPIVFLFM
jgi:Na+/phosphate symporter